MKHFILASLCIICWACSTDTAEPNYEVGAIAGKWELTEIDQGDGLKPYDGVLRMELESEHCMIQIGDSVSICFNYISDEHQLTLSSDWAVLTYNYIVKSDTLRLKPISVDYKSVYVWMPEWSEWENDMYIFKSLGL
ncbi:MAG: hypothetical protein J6Z14_10890 [Prevotella sp.]|nr:hypothetical protein [Prevotella sp.]